MQSLAFFIDVDNTLLNNDHIKEEIKRSLVAVLGEDEASHFWKHHDAFRTEQKLVDFPRIIKQYCDHHYKDRCEIIFMEVFDTIEFTHALFPQAKAVLKHLKTLGIVSLFTEGDSVYQKMKIEKSGLSRFVDNIFLFENKLVHLSEVIERFRDNKKVFIDDHAEILVKIETAYPEVVTVEILQGHYSTIDHKEHRELDKKLARITDLMKYRREDFT